MGSKHRSHSLARPLRSCPTCHGTGWAPPDSVVTRNRGDGSPAAYTGGVVRCLCTRTEKPTLAQRPDFQRRAAGDRDEE